jgi:glycosyltransferase involved in cell wall biosynthesis
MSKNQIRFSIIIPNYNKGQYINECLSSVINQSYKNLEIIVIDDGSTDNSGTICDEYAIKDNRIRVFHKENGGVSSARNWGLDKAIGEYIMFVDSDDYMLPGMLEVMLSTLESKKTDLVVCGTTETGGGYWRPIADVDYSINQLKENFVSLLHTELLSPPWNKIYKKEIIGSNRFCEDISFGEDLLFNIQYLEKCENISLIKESPFYHEKENENSLVVKFNRNRLLDIEKVWVVVDRFSEDKEGLYSKYLRDLTVYIRQLLKTKQYLWSEKKNILEEWSSMALIKNLNLFNYKIYYLNWVLLLLLKNKQWKLANILVNLKSYFRVK